MYVSLSLSLSLAGKMPKGRVDDLEREFLQAIVSLLRLSLCLCVCLSARNRVVVWQQESFLSTDRCMFEPPLA